jgi:clan AA aspartic protease
MIRGRVTLDLQPLVTIDIEGRDGVFRPFEVILDTGFNGDLMLSSGIIQRLGLTYQRQMPFTLADSQELQASAYDGVVSWHGRRRDAEIIETEGESLLGMSMLLGSKLTVSARIGGEVLIEEEDLPT